LLNVIPTVFPIKGNRPESITTRRIPKLHTSVHLSWPNEAAISGDMNATLPARSYDF